MKVWGGIRDTHAHKSMLYNDGNYYTTEFSGFFSPLVAHVV